MREALRAKIEAAAKRRDVSLNAEAIDRLERSFREDQLQIQQFGGEYTLTMMKLLAAAIQVVEQRTGKKWNEDRDTFIEALTAIYGMLGAFGGLSPERIKKIVRAENRTVGLQVARVALKFAGLTETQIRDFLGMGDTRRKSILLTGEMSEKKESKR